MALSTEIAGVMMPSPKRSAAPTMTSAAMSPTLPTGARRSFSGFALVVGAHQESQVLDGDDHRQGPNDERYDAKDIAALGGHAVVAVQTLLDGVERARPDIAEDNPNRADNERERTAAVRGCSLRRRFPRGIDRRLLAHPDLTLGLSSLPPDRAARSSSAGDADGFDRRRGAARAVFAGVGGAPAAAGVDVARASCSHRSDSAREYGNH
jgi:hypothetical protein